MSNGNKIVTGLIAGALAGAIAGLLFAPKPGKETRNVVTTRSVELRNKAEGYAGTLREKVRRGGGDPIAENASYNDHVRSAN